MKCGDIVRDRSSGAVGVVTGEVGRLVTLRPIEGGRSWLAAPAILAPLTGRELLIARVHERNHNSRRFGGCTHRPPGSWA